MGIKCSNTRDYIVIYSKCYKPFIPSQTYQLRRGTGTAHKAGTDNEPAFLMALEAVLEVLPPSRTFTGFDPAKAVERKIGVAGIFLDCRLYSFHAFDGSRLFLVHIGINTIAYG
jgi:hypothetical protein